MATLASDADAGGSSTDKLIRFGQSLLSDSAGPALRAWAQADANVAKTLEEVDKARIEQLTGLMREIGLRNEDFAKAAFGALIGLQQTHLDDGDALVAYAALIDVTLAGS